MSDPEWIRKIPVSWRVMRLKMLVSEPLQYGANEAAVLTDPNLPRYIRITDICEDGTLRAETFKSLPQESAAPYLLKGGDLLFARSGATVGKTFRYDSTWGPAAYAGYLIRARMNKMLITSTFAHYFAQSNPYWNWLRSNLVQATIQNVSAERYANLRVPVPPVADQCTIVTFLDRETAKIAALIQKKRRLIELLNEKRAALISHAVTKGLDSSVAMRPSGVEWIGKIPAHWATQTLGALARIVRGGSPRPAGDPRFFSGDYIPWVVVGELTKDTSKHLAATSTMLTSAGAKSSRRFQSETLLLTNSGATLGVPKILKIEACANDGVLGFLDLSADTCIDYLYYYLTSLTENYRARLRQGCGQPNLNTSMVKETQAPFPPVREQGAIALKLDQQVGEVEDLKARIYSAVDLLQEYRAALISAAVTGQIDVRGEV